MISTEEEEYVIQFLNRPLISSILERNMVYLC